MSKSISKKEADYDRVDRLAERADRVLSQVRDSDDSVEEYTDRELAYLDRFKALTGDKMDDEEIYDLIIKHNFDDSRIEKEIRDHLKYIQKKGDEYGWTKIEKGKSI